MKNCRFFAFLNLSVLIVVALSRKTVDTSATRTAVSGRGSLNQ